MTHLLSYLQQDEFNVDCFIERLARNTLQGGSVETGEDVVKLRDAFKFAIDDFKDEFQRREKISAKYEHGFSNAVEQMTTKIEDLTERHRALQMHYGDLHKQMSEVSAKASYIGDLLESVHEPRLRCLEATSLIKQLDDIINEESGKDSRDEISRRSSQSGIPVDKYAENFLKLFIITSELPDIPRYQTVKQKLATKYSQIEVELLTEMAVCQRQGDLKRMKEIVSLMSNLRGYNACMDQFITTVQKKAFVHPDIFIDIIPLYKRAYHIVTEVFPNPDHIMSKLMETVINGKIKDYIKNQLCVEDCQLYLIRLHHLYMKTVTLCTELEQQQGMDGSFRSQLHRIPRQLFQGYLRTYVALEYRYMDQRLNTLLRAYYQSVGHQRKNITSTLPLKGIRRDIQSKIKPRAASIINLAPSVKDFGGETYICEILSVNVLQEMRESFDRTALLLREPENARQARLLWQLVNRKLCKDHLLYGLNMGIKTIPVSQDLNEEPKQYFMRTVYQCNAIWHLIEDIYREKVLPLVESSPEVAIALHSRTESLSAMEEIIRVGLKRSIKAYAAWIRVLLSRQKYDEFRSTESTPTSQKVCTFASRCIQVISQCLDGQNKVYVLSEFGRRFHKALLDNINRFLFGCEAGVGLLCDVAEYRQMIAQIKSPTLDKVFDVLHQLCSILIVPAENLLDVCQSESLRQLDESILREFVQLRSDCKSRRLIPIIFHDCG